MTLSTYTYGYSFVTMGMTRKFITNYAIVQGGRGPIGQIIKLRTPPGRERSNLFESETIAGK